MPRATGLGSSTIGATRTSCKTVDAMIVVSCGSPSNIAWLLLALTATNFAAVPDGRNMRHYCFPWKSGHNTHSYYCFICHPSINRRLIRQSFHSTLLVDGAMDGWCRRWAGRFCFSWMMCGGKTVFCFVLFLERLEGTAGRKTPTSSSSRPAASKSSLVSGENKIFIFFPVFFW